jgi:hypothetical protein
MGVATQTAVADALTIAFAGQYDQMAQSTHIDSKYSEESADEIPFGVMVIRGTDEDDGALKCHTSSAVTAPLMAGVVVHNHAHQKDNELGSTGLKPDVSFGVMTRGRVYVTTEEAVTIGDAVRVRAVISGDEVAGAFRTTADDTSDCVELDPSMARWVRGAGIGELALLELDMLGAAGTADS